MLSEERLAIVSGIVLASIVAHYLRTFGNANDYFFVRRAGWSCKNRRVKIATATPRLHSRYFTLAPQSRFSTHSSSPNDEYGKSKAIQAMLVASSTGIVNVYNYVETGAETACALPRSLRQSLHTYLPHHLGASILPEQHMHRAANYCWLHLKLKEYVPPEN